MGRADHILARAADYRRELEIRALRRQGLICGPNDHWCYARMLRDLHKNTAHLKARYQPGQHRSILWSPSHGRRLTWERHAARKAANA